MFNFILALLGSSRIRSLILYLPFIFSVILNFYFFNVNKELKSKIVKLENENTKIHKLLDNYILENNKLKKEIVLQKEKYEKDINKLLKIANKKPKVIYIPKVITKKVYVTKKECEQMCLMIDKFIEIEKGSKKGKENEK